MNSIGRIFRFTDFGESHGPAVGGVIDGVPSGVEIDMDYIREQLRRRSGVDMAGASQRARQEEDEVEWLSGMMDGVTTGAPIAFLIRNRSVRSEDYSEMRDVYRPGHADYTYEMKYGIRDYRGGGRASARETVARVVAGSVAQQLLRDMGVTVRAKVEQIGEEQDESRWEDMIRCLRAESDSIGGIIRCTVQGLPAGVGNPVFDKLQARLAYAVMSINSCKGFEYGSGFSGVGKRGSELNDQMPYRTNHAGGILGGISNGQEVYFRAVFKPVASIGKRQMTIDRLGREREIEIRGRHDVCAVLRMPVIVEAMTAMTVLDLIVES